jgi:hypothetical protein
MSYASEASPPFLHQIIVLHYHLCSNAGNESHKRQVQAHIQQPLRTHALQSHRAVVGRAYNDGLAWAPLRHWVPKNLARAFNTGHFNLVAQEPAHG